MFRKSYSPKLSKLVQSMVQRDAKKRRKASDLWKDIKVYEEYILDLDST